MALVLQALGGNQALDLGGLGVGLGALLLGLNLATDHVLADLYPGGRVDNILALRFQESQSSHSLPERLGGVHHNTYRAGEDGTVCGVGGTYIVLLGEAEELADLGGALGAETLGVDDVGQAGDLLLALLDDGEGQNGQVHADNAAADGLALALAGAAGAVAGVAVGQKEADTGGVHDTLLHRETLLVVAAGDAEDVSLPLVAEGVSGDLSAHL